MIDPQAAATTQRETAAARIARLEGQLENARKEHKQAVEFLAAFAHFSGDTSGSEDEPTPVRENNKRNPTKEAVAEMAVKVLREVGRPLFRALLYKELVARGLELKGKDPVVVLSTMLWRMKDVVPFYQGAGYWPVNDPMPEGFSRGVDSRDPDYDESPCEVEPVDE